MTTIAVKIATRIADTIGGGEITPSHGGDAARIRLNDRSAGVKLLRTLKSTGFTPRVKDKPSWFKLAPDKSYCLVVTLDPTQNAAFVTVFPPLDDARGGGRSFYPKPSRTGTLLHALINRMVYAVRGSGAFWMEADYYARLFAESRDPNVRPVAYRLLRCQFSEETASSLFDGGKVLRDKTSKSLFADTQKVRDLLDEALEAMEMEIDQSPFGNG